METITASITIQSDGESQTLAAWKIVNGGDVELLYRSKSSSVACSPLEEASSILDATLFSWLAEKAGQQILGATG